MSMYSKVLLSVSVLSATLLVATVVEVDRRRLAGSIRRGVANSRGCRSGADSSDVQIGCNAGHLSREALQPG